MPKKVTWHAATVAETIHQAGAYGFHVKESEPFDWTYFKRKRDAYVKRLNNIYEKNLNNDKVKYYHGTATFTGQDQVEVTLDDGSKQTIRSKKILIAVGGHPSPPPDIPGAKLGTNSDGFFEIEKQPKKVALIGAGYIAVEFAGMFHSLGTETHLFIRHSNFLRAFDPLIQDTLTKEYVKRGIHVHKNSSQSKIEDLGNGNKRLHYKDENGEGTLDVDSLIWAIGRSPEIEALALDKLSLKQTDKGHVIVDEYQNTSAEGIYAIGDVCDRGFELTPVAIAAGRKLADRLFGGKSEAHLEYADIPSAVFAHPEAGSIGLPEPAAREKYGDANVKVYTSNFTAMYYAMMDEQADKAPTSYKLVCVGKEEKVVGLHIVGMSSSEVLQGFGVAVKMGATKKDFDSCVAIHPTSAEELVTMK